ncbi:MAG: THUMP domain-containing protein [Candidatus Neomarinimicrobiota bacterium]
MDYLYQRSQRYFAQVADDIKQLAEAELGSLGAQDVIPTYRGLYFSADRSALYRINLMSRLINRVLAPLVTFDCHSDKYLYLRAGQVLWQDFIAPDQTLAVFATVTHSTIKHSKFAALRLKDAIADQYRTRTGKRPSIDTRDPDLWLNLHIQNNKATISVDTSGGSLHRRGYRQAGVTAPMIETLAAAIIKMAEWDGWTPLYDPCCGSGTLLCEAFLAATNTPAAVLRKKFGFERLPDFEPETWRSVRQRAFGQITELPPGLIGGCDIDRQTVATARGNCTLIDKSGRIEIIQKDLFTIPALEDTTIIANPPYGLRLKEDDLADFYRRLGDFLKQRCHGSRAYIYFGERQYLKHIGLRPAWKQPLANGGLDGRLARFDLY